MFVLVYFLIYNFSLSLCAKEVINKKIPFKILEETFSPVLFGTVKNCARYKENAFQGCTRENTGLRVWKFPFFH